MHARDYDAHQHGFSFAPSVNTTDKPARSRRIRKPRRIILPRIIPYVIGAGFAGSLILIAYVSASTIGAII